MKNISEQRNEVIEKFINLDTIINAIISQHYFKKVFLPFYLEVLYDEYFTFGLKRRILEKIIVNIDKNKIDHLNKLNTIRNDFAHCNQEMYKIDNIEKPIIPDPRNTNKFIDFNNLYDEFIKKEPNVSKYLFEVYIDLGGEFSSSLK